MLKFGIIDHKTAIKIAIILKKIIFRYDNNKTFFTKFFIRSYNIYLNENDPNYPKCIKLAAPFLFIHLLGGAQRCDTYFWRML
jgi:hypothetical protein